MSVTTKPSISELSVTEKPRSLKILLIGGTGFVGSQLTPELRSRGHHVVVASRYDNAALGIIGRNHWLTAIDRADIVAVLSVINNDVTASDEEIYSVNVDLPLELANHISKHPKKRLILFGSDHADNTVLSSVYSRSKAALVERLNAQTGAAVTMFILSPVHGPRFIKKLSFINQIPSPLKAIAVSSIGALRPLSHVKKIADAIENVGSSPTDQNIFHRVVDDQDENPIYRTVTRLCDIAFAVVVIFLFGWLMVILAIVIRSTSTGPALFQQARVGRNGCVFTCYKFRTMAVDAPQVATHQAAASAITPVGKRLRDWKLDELPQIFNILANDMSLVGPRPCLTTQIELIEARRRYGVLAVKPGITGLSQILGIDMSDPKKLAQTDAKFCTRRSIPLYFRIAILTFIGRGRGDRVR